MTHPVDLHVGQQIRRRRRVLGLSQSAVADRLGLTFQQVQKYERGANRVSASKLFEIAQLLQTSVGSFFEGLGDFDAAQASEDELTIASFAVSDYGRALILAVCAIPAGKLRDGVLNLARSMADQDKAD